MIGKTLGPYRILDKLGEGGMGEVDRARDTRIVAIKVLASALASDVQSRERFEREAKAISSLNHPNICALYDVGRERPAGAMDSDAAPVDFPGVWAGIWGKQEEYSGQVRLEPDATL